MHARASRMDARACTCVYSSCPEYYNNICKPGKFICTRATPRRRHIRGEQLRGRQRQRQRQQPAPMRLRLFGASDGRPARGDGVYKYVCTYRHIRVYVFCMDTCTRYSRLWVQNVCERPAPRSYIVPNRMGICTCFGCCGHRNT